MRSRLNLATHRFPRYRRANLALAGLLAVALLVGGALASDYVLNPPDLRGLELDERELRADWNDLGQQIDQVEARLQETESTTQMSELTFLSQIMARKQFSWTRMLREIERVIPASVQLVGLIPDIGEGGQVFVQMEARGRSIGDLSDFIANLEMSEAFRDVRAVEQEEGVFDGRQEFRLVMGADYVEAALTGVSVTNE